MVFHCAIIYHLDHIIDAFFLPIVLMVFNFYTCVSIGSFTIDRNLLGYLLVSSQEGEDAHTGSRCSIVDPSSSPNLEGSKSAFEIVGAEAVACFANGKSNNKFSFSTCRCQSLSGPGAILQLQKYRNLFLLCLASNYVVIFFP